jgi:hypothetical protein
VRRTWARSYSARPASPIDRKEYFLGLRRRRIRAEARRQYEPESPAVVSICMRFRAASVAFATAVLLVGLASAAPSAPIGSFTLHGSANRPTGLVMTGGSLAWGVALADGEVQLRGLINGRIRVLYRAGLPKAPPDDPSSAFRTIVHQSLSVFGTSTNVALIRRVDYVRHPKCRDGPVKCGAPELVEPQSAEVLAGGLRSTFRVVARADRRQDACAPLPVDLDAAQRSAVYASEAATRCPQQAGRVSLIVKISLAGNPRPRLLDRLVDVHIMGVAYAGRYVAWSEFHEGRCPCASIVLRDLRTGRKIRISSRNFTGHDPALQPDGKLVFVGGVTRKLGQTVCGRDEVAFVARGGHAPRFLGRPFVQLGGFAAGRVAYVANPPNTCVGTPLQLVIQSLNGRAVVLRGLQQVLAGIDFDGRRLATATPVGADTLVRVERIP